MAKPSRHSSLMKPWAWLAAVAAVCLVLASSTALYAINSSVKLGLPWWTAVAAPTLVYALVLPLCVPGIRPASWLVGFVTLAVLHAVLGLATTWLYAQVGLTSFEEALAPAFWGFPPALILEMVGSVLMTLPFLGALAPRVAAPRAQAETSQPRAAAPKRAKQEVPAAAEPPSRHSWTRPLESPAEPAAAAILSAGPPPVAAVAPVVEEPPMAAPEQPVVHAAPLVGTNGSASEVAEPMPEAVPDFRQALAELFGDPVSETKAEVEVVPEAPSAPVAHEVTPSLAAEAPAVAPVPEASVTPPEPVAPVAPATASEMVRISFDRVVGQLPPGAFRVPLAQVGARLREPETLLVAQALILPQLGEGVVQVAWEAVVEQFPAAVFAVAPAAVKERIVNGRLLLPLDEIVRQLPPDVFGASMGRGPVQVPGIESFPAPFKPLGWEEPAPPVERAPVVESGRGKVPHTIEVPSAAEIAEDLKWTPPSSDVIDPLRTEPASAAVPTDTDLVDADPVLESMSESVVAAAAPVVEPAPEPIPSPAATAGPVATEAVVRIPFDRVAAQLPSAAFRVPLGEVGARLHLPDMLLVPEALIVPQLGEGAVSVAWDAVVAQFPAEVFAVTPMDVKDRIEGGRLALPLDEIVRQLPPEVFGSAMTRGPVHVPGIEGFPAPFKPLGYEEPSPPPVAVAPVSAPAPPEPVIEVAEPASTRAESVSVPASPEPVVAAVEPISAPASPEPVIEAAEPEIAAPPPPVPVAPLYETQVFERPAPAEPPAPLADRRGHAEMVAALFAPLGTVTFEEAHIGDTTVIGVSTAGIPSGPVAAAAGRLTSLIARGAPQPIEQVTLRGVGGVLVLTPIGSGWTSGTTLAVGVRAGGALARLEMLARRAARQVPGRERTSGRGDVPLARLEATQTPSALAAAAEDLTIFGPVAAQSFREPASGAVVHCLVSPVVSATELAPFAWELAQAMTQSAPAEALGVFHSAVLRSGSTRVEIRRLPSAPGLALLLVVGGTDTGRPGLARLQVERTAARLSVA